MLTLTNLITIYRYRRNTAMKKSQILKNVLRGAMVPLSLSVATAIQAAGPVANPEAVVVVGNARFTVLTPEMIRIEYSDKGKFEDRATFAIQNRDLESVPAFKKSEDGEFLYITTDRLSLKYRKGTDPRTVPASPANLTVTMNHNGQPVTWYPGKPDPLNLKGTCRTLDGSNGDNKRSEMEDGIISRSGWAVIDDSWTAARADGSRSFPLEENGVTAYPWWGERQDTHAMDTYFLGYGSDYKKAIYDFTKVAGKIPLPPDYVFGYWYSKYASYSADDYRQIMTDLADNGIPADVMILDMDWHWNGDPASGSAGIGGWTGWSWNTNLIPEPKKLLKEIHDRNFKIALNLHPADGINSVESPGYYNAMKGDLNGKYDNNGPIGWNLDFPDFTNSFFNRVIRDHESEGVDFWWLDWQQYLTSPYTQGLGETFWCNYVFFNDMAKNRPDRRPVIFHRWGGLGSHRYQLGFSGDALINFPTLAFQPYFTATASNVGYAFWGHDLGGHAFTDEQTVNDPELVLRWIQFGVFTPIFRTHATKDDRIERRIWKFANFPEMLDAVKLRYALFPYLYTMARKTYDTGLGMCRPLYYEYPDQEEAYTYEGEYFFGDDILVAPVTEPAADGKTAVKEIWFPEGNWWSVSTNELIEGPCVKRMAFTSGQIPYFFREGAMIPYNPPTVKNVTERPAEMILNVVAGAEGAGSLYEDAADNSDYATVYATTPFSHTVAGATETYMISPREGSYPGAVADRQWTLRIHNATLPKSVKINGVENRANSWSYDAGKRCLTVTLPKSACSQANRVEVTYSGEVTALENVTVPGCSIDYDRANDTLTASLGNVRRKVSLSVCDMAGMEFVSKSYDDVAGFSENLAALAPAMYLCLVKADGDTTVKKFRK